jgi:hypothetical protein
MIIAVYLACPTSGRDYLRSMTSEGGYTTKYRLVAGLCQRYDHLHNDREQAMPMTDWAAL